MKLRLTDRKALEDAKKRMDEGYGTITATKAFKLSGLYEEKFKAEFKRLFGMTPSAYLFGVRMAAAAGKLLATDDKMVKIANEVGYATKQSFLNAFKKKYNIAPGAYRKRDRANIEFVNKQLYILSESEFASHLETAFSSGACNLDKDREIKNILLSVK